MRKSKGRIIKDTILEDWGEEIASLLAWILVVGLAVVVTVVGIFTPQWILMKAMKFLLYGLGILLFIGIVSVLVGMYSTLKKIRTRVKESEKGEWHEKENSTNVR